MKHKQNLILGLIGAVVFYSSTMIDTRPEDELGTCYINEYEMTLTLKSQCVGGHFVESN